MSSIGLPIRLTAGLMLGLGVAPPAVAQQPMPQFTPGPEQMPAPMMPAMPGPTPGAMPQAVPPAPDLGANYRGFVERRRAEERALMEFMMIAPTLRDPNSR